METLKELALVLGRIMTILPLVLFMTCYFISGGRNYKKEQKAQAPRLASGIANVP
jgi:hypothetical protein